eukprot:1518914-Lingulodinium_polyedra.AAC.1
MSLTTLRFERGRHVLVTSHSATSRLAEEVVLPIGGRATKNIYHVLGLKRVAVWVGGKTRLWEPLDVGTCGKPNRACRTP